MKIHFRLCKCCSKWSAELTCPDCDKKISCGEVADTFAEEYALGGAWEDAVYSSEVDCECGFFGFVGEFVKDKPIEDDPVFKKHIIFDVESKYD